MTSGVETLTLASVIGTAAVSGMFYTFSTFTMSGLRRLSPAEGVRAMQAINLEAPKFPLLSVMVGTALACVALMVVSGWTLTGNERVLHLVGGALYLVGAIFVTGAYHVPRNNRLERLDANSLEGQAYWPIYYREWVRMNHVRTGAPLLAAILFGTSFITS